MEKRTVFITAYVFSRGIMIRDAEVEYRDGKPLYVTANPNVYRRESNRFYWPDFHFTREAAVAEAERRRDKELVALRAKIKRLENLKF